MRSVIASCSLIVLATVASGAGRQAAQAPPDTEIYLAPLSIAKGALEVGTPVNITNNPGYDNQPFFTPDGKSLLFTSVRGPSPGVREGSLTRTDIYRYDIAARSVSRVTQTAEGEYSPTAMLDGTRISVIRVEADGTQRLASIAPSGPKIEVNVILPDIKPVGYHAWADEHTVAMFILGGNGAPATLQVADTRTGKARVLATDIGRSVQRMPGTGASRHISFVQRTRDGDAVTLTVNELDPATGQITVLTPAVEGAREADLAWAPDGTLLMASGGALYGWKRGQSGWKEVASLERLSLRGVTRLAVSPSGDSIALVGSPAPTR
jgi:Tol biopolymer transport system component